TARGDDTVSSRFGMRCAALEAARMPSVSRLASTAVGSLLTPHAARVGRVAGVDRDPAARAWRQGGALRDRADARSRRGRRASGATRMRFRPRAPDRRRLRGWPSHGMAAAIAQRDANIGRPSPARPTGAHRRDSLAPRRGRGPRDALLPEVVAELGAGVGAELGEDLGDEGLLLFPDPLAHAEEATAGRGDLDAQVDELRAAIPDPTDELAQEE